MPQMTPNSVTQRHSGGQCPYLEATPRHLPSQTARNGAGETLGRDKKSPVPLSLTPPTGGKSESGGGRDGASQGQTKAAGADRLSFLLCPQGGGQAKGGPRQGQEPRGRGDHTHTLAPGRGQQGPGQRKPHTSCLVSLTPQPSSREELNRSRGESGRDVSAYLT